MRFNRVFLVGAAAGLALGLGLAALVSLRPGGESAGAPSAGGGPNGRPGGAFVRGGALPAITTAEVERTSLGRTLDAIGSGRAAKSVTLVSEATGLVETVAAEPGALVSAGDLILKLDDSEQKIAVARARAQYPIAKANAERYAALYKEDSASRLETDTAFNAYKSAEAELKAAEYALKQRSILAPFDGVVGLTTLEPGDYLRSGDLVTTIDDLSALIIEFAVPQEAAADVRIGQAVEAALAGGPSRRISGAVSAIDSRVDPASRTLRIEATFSNEAGELLPGATYAVRTTNEGADALSVPGLAVQWDRTGAFLWVLGDGGEARRAAVEVLQRRDEIAVVRGDIAEGDSIVVEGADRVRPGMIFTRAGAAGRASAGSAGAG